MYKRILLFQQVWRHDRSLLMHICKGDTSPFTEHFWTCSFLSIANFTAEISFMLSPNLIIMFSSSWFGGIQIEFNVRCMILVIKNYLNCSFKAHKKPEILEFLVSGDIAIDLNGDWRKECHWLYSPRKRKKKKNHSKSITNYRFYIDERICASCAKKQNQISFSISTRSRFQ